MEIKIWHVNQETDLMIHLDSCKKPQSPFLYSFQQICFLGFNSLFQVVESIGELADRFGIKNVERHDSCSALIKVRKT
jgi:hypothetical protein